MGKRNFFVKREDRHSDTSTFEGFDIKINESDAKRIDRLVDNYESRILMHLDEEYIRRTKWSDKIADRVASFGGSWAFIMIFAVILALWILWNTIALTEPYRFDKQPFILLNLCLSFIAAFQAPIIMMSQNRQAARDKHESVIDFAINYKAEQEIDDMQSHLHRIEGKLYELEQLLLTLDKQQIARQQSKNSQTMV